MVYLETVLYKNFPLPERGRKSDYITSSVSQAPEQLDCFSFCFLIRKTACSNKFLVANTCRKQLKHNNSYIYPENRKGDRDSQFYGCNTIKKPQGKNAALIVRTAHRSASWNSAFEPRNINSAGQYHTQSQACQQCLTVLHRVQINEQTPLLEDLKKKNLAA